MKNALLQQISVNSHTCGSEAKTVAGSTGSLEVTQTKCKTAVSGFSFGVFLPCFVPLWSSNL